MCFVVDQLRYKIMIFDVNFESHMQLQRGRFEWNINHYFQRYWTLYLLDMVKTKSIAVYKTKRKL